MFNWLTKIFGSKEKKAVIKELSEEEKDLKEMESELSKLKSRKFRVERVEHNDGSGEVFYYAQIHGKRKHHEFYTKEYNENEWWGLLIGQGDYVYISPHLDRGSARSDEQGALELIERYKKWTEDEIRRRPERNKFLRDYEKQKEERRKELKAEYEKTKPKSTYKEI